MSNGIIKVNPGLLALVQGTDTSLLLFARELMVLDCQVAGTSHQDLQDVEPALKPGDRFLLIREPENEFDKFAVAIYASDKKKLGYLPRAKNETIARLLDAGKTIFGSLVSKKWTGDWLQLSVNVFLLDS